MNAREVIAQSTGSLEEADQLLTALAREGYEVTAVTSLPELLDARVVNKCGNGQCPCRQM